MTDLNEIFGYKRCGGYMTSRQLKNFTEWTKEYRGYTIAFSKYITDANGKRWWTVRVWENDGKDRFGAFTTSCTACAIDADAMGEEIKWAKANIDRLLAA